MSYISVASCLFRGVVRQLFVDKTDTTIAVLAFMIAVVSLYVAVHQLRASVRHNKISTKPRLRVEAEYRRHSDSFRLSLVNTGLGPAFIKSAFVNFTPEDDRQREDENHWIHSPVNEVLASLIGEQVGGTRYPGAVFQLTVPHSLANDFAIGAGQRVTILETSGFWHPVTKESQLPFMPLNELAVMLDFQCRQWVFDVRYETAYGEVLLESLSCWSAPKSTEDLMKWNELYKEHFEHKKKDGNPGAKEGQ